MKRMPLISETRMQLFNSKENKLKQPFQSHKNVKILTCHLCESQIELAFLGIYVFCRPAQLTKSEVLPKCK